MPAPKGNKNREIYIPEDIVELMDKVCDGLLDGSYSSIHRAYLDNGIYSSLVGERKRIHKDNSIVLDAIRRVSKIGHEVLRCNMLDGLVNTTAGIWIDKTVYKTKEAEEKKENQKIEIVVSSASQVKDDSKR